MIRPDEAWDLFSRYERAAGARLFALAVVVLGFVAAMIRHSDFPVKVAMLIAGTILLFDYLFSFCPKCGKSHYAFHLSDKPVLRHILWIRLPLPERVCSRCGTRFDIPDLPSR